MILDWLAVIATAWSTPVAPPATPRPPEQFAATLVVGDGPSQGKPLVMSPATREILRGITRNAQRIVVVGPVQDGKTYGATVVPAIYAMAEGRFSVLLAGPRKEDVDALYLDKIRTTMEASGYGWALPVEGAGSRRGVPDQLLCSTGVSFHLRGAGGANEAQMSGITCRWVILTEADGIALSTGRARRATAQEGRRKVELFARRTSSWERQGRVIIETTVKDDRNSLGLALYGESTGGRLWHQCPHCRAWGTREWAQVSYDPADHATAAATARIRCDACKAQLTPLEASEAAQSAVWVHRGQRLEQGVAVGAITPLPVHGLRWTSLDSPAPSKALDLLCQEHLAATIAANTRGDYAPLRQFHRDQLTEPFTGDPAAVAAAKRASTHAIAARSAASDYDQGTVPFDGILSVAIDMQEREAYWVALVQAFDGERTALVDWGESYLCHRHETPSRGQRLAVLDDIRRRAERGWSRVGGVIVPAAVGGIDVGGRGWLDQVDDWLRATSWRWFAMRGDGRSDDERRKSRALDSAPGWWQQYQRDDGRNLLMADAASIKVRVVDGLAAKVDHAGAFLLPRGIAASAWISRHLCAEERVPGPHGPTWVQIDARNDFLDCTVYAKALAHHAAGRPQAAAEAVPTFV